MAGNGTAVATIQPAGGALQVHESRPVQLLRPIAEPSVVMEAQNQTRAFVHEALVKGRDFGVIPGTDKPTMLKPGAERVALAFGCFYGDPEIVEQEVDHDRVVPWTKTKWVTTQKPANHAELKAKGLGRNRQFNGQWVWQEKQEEQGSSLGLYRYVMRVPVISRETGAVVGYGIGAASTMESKYIDRPRDSENTVLKMAHKRALVAACLVTFGLSDEFTQDVEDLPQFAGEQPATAGEESRASGSATAAPSTPAEPLPPLTLELARTMRLPGGPTAFQGNGGKLLTEFKPKHLRAIADWMVKKDTERFGDAIPAETERLVQAMRMIADDAERNPAQLDAMAENGGNAGSNPARSDGTPTGEDRSANRQATPPSGAAVAASGGSDVREITGAIKAMIADEKWTAEERDAWTKKLVACVELTELQLLHAEIENELQLPFE